MYILNISNAIKKMSINEIRYFIFKNYCKQIRLLLGYKQSSYYSMKRLRKRFVAAR